MYARNQIMGASAQTGQEYGAALGAVNAFADGAARQPEVVAEMERLDRAVEGLAVVVDTLMSRLAPVRQQCVNLATKGETVSAPQPVLCKMADMIRAQRERIEMQHVAVQRALNELEI